MVTILIAQKNLSFLNIKKKIKALLLVFPLFSSIDSPKNDFGELVIKPEEVVFLRYKNAPNSLYPLSAVKLLEMRCPFFDREYNNLCTELLKLLPLAITEEMVKYKYEKYNELIVFMENLKKKYQEAINSFNHEKPKKIEKSLTNFNSILDYINASDDHAIMKIDIFYNLVDLYAQYFPASKEWFRDVLKRISKSSIQKRCLKEKKLIGIISCASAYSPEYYEYLSTRFVENFEDLYKALEKLNATLTKINEEYNNNLLNNAAIDSLLQNTYARQIYVNKQLDSYNKNAEIAFEPDIFINYNFTEGSRNSTKFYCDNFRNQKDSPNYPYICSQKYQRSLQKTTLSMALLDRFPAIIPLLMGFLIVSLKPLPDENKRKDLFIATVVVTCIIELMIMVALEKIQE